MKIDNRVFVIPLPEDNEDERGGRNYGQHDDEVRFEPVFALSFIENDLQRSEAERYETEAGVINARFAQLTTLEIRWVLNQPRRQYQRKNPYRNIDKENPAPGKVVGNPPAERRPDRGRHHHRDAINSECHAALGGLKSIGDRKSTRL